MCETHARQTHRASSSLSTTMPLSVVHSLTPVSLTAGFLFRGNSENLAITNSAISSPLDRLTGLGPGARESLAMRVRKCRVTL